MWTTQSSKKMPFLEAEEGALECGVPSRSGSNRTRMTTSRLMRCDWDSIVFMLCVRRR